MAHVMDKYFDKIVASTVDILKFDSSLKPAEGENGEYPFGKETADCLQFFLDLAKSFGFETHNYDNYIGEVVFGRGEEFAILAHLDVVPAGNGWKYPPFILELTITPFLLIPIFPWDLPITDLKSASANSQIFVLRTRDTEPLKRRIATSQIWTGADMLLR